MTQRLICFTIDLEPDFLSENSHEVLLDRTRFQQLEVFFQHNQIRPTVFVTAKMLEEGLPVQERFANINAEFELHSYSHNIHEPDSEREIVLGKEIYIRHFGHPPRGYRAPNGDISAQGLQVLHREGFLYDASVFPTWRPELGYNFRMMPCTPWQYLEFPGLVEFPFAVVPKVQTVISLSFLKLFGLQLYRVLFNTLGFPEILVFDTHLYDFFPTSPVRNLSRLDWRRYALMRNQNNVLPLLQQFVDFITNQGYSFVSVQDVYDLVTQSRRSMPLVSAAPLLRSRSAGETVTGEVMEIKQ